MSTTTRVLVTLRSLTAAGLDAVPELEPLRRGRFQLVGAPPGQLPTEEELLALVPGCVGWLAGVERISGRVLAAATELRVIARNGTGTDAIDLAAAADAGVRVERAAGANAQGVAELAVTLALCALRQVLWTATVLRHGGWQRRPGREIAECTVGVVGLGAVGHRVAALFTALGADVVGHDPYVADPGVRAAGLAELLATSDVVTLHCPPLPAGRPLLDRARLATMPAGAVLVNTARSALVDDGAVLDALTDGRLAAYAVDSFDTEPPAPSRLLSHQRVIATPHLGGYTGASIRRATSAAVQNLLVVLEGG